MISEMSCSKMCSTMGCGRYEFVLRQTSSKIETEVSAEFARLLR